MIGLVFHDIIHALFTEWIKRNITNNLLLFVSYVLFIGVKWLFHNKSIDFIILIFYTTFLFDGIYWIKCSNKKNLVCDLD